jgi:hypothetical protein
MRNSKLWKCFFSAKTFLKEKMHGITNGGKALSVSKAYAHFKFSDRPQQTLQMAMEIVLSEQAHIFWPLAAPRHIRHQGHFAKENIFPSRLHIPNV